MYKNIAKNNIKRNKKTFYNKFRNIIIISFVAVSIVTIVVLSTYKTTQAREELSLNKYYKTIIIQPEDTLWNIAEEYKNGSGAETKNIVKEIKKINNISSDNLITGMKLIIPYYAE